MFQFAAVSGRTGPWIGRGDAAGGGHWTVSGSKEAWSCPDALCKPHDCRLRDLYAQQAMVALGVSVQLGSWHARDSNSVPDRADALVSRSGGTGLHDGCPDTKRVG